MAQQMMQVPQYAYADRLASQLLDEFKKANAPRQQGTMNGFAEPHNGMEETMQLGGLFKIQGNGLVIALGVALSSMVTGFFSKFLPFGSGGIAKIIVAIILKKFIAKAGGFKDFADGVLLAGIAELAGGLTSGLKIFGMPRTGFAGYNNNPGATSFSEPEVTSPMEGCSSCRPKTFGGREVGW